MTDTGFTSGGTIPLCGYCGRPVGFGDAMRFHNGVYYHFECTRPPQPVPQFAPLAPRAVDVDRTGWFGDRPVINDR